MSPGKSRLDVEPLKEFEGRLAWVDMNIIDGYFLKVILENQPGFAYLETREGIETESAESLASRIKALFVGEVHTVFYPYRWLEHFRLLIIKKNITIHYDSNKYSEGLSTHAMDLLKELGDPECITDNWPHQGDNDSCGIYVMLYAAHFIKKDIWSEKDANEEVPLFREKALKELKKHFKLYIDNRVLTSPSKRSVAKVESYNEEHLMNNHVRQKKMNHKCVLSHSVSRIKRLESRKTKKSRINQFSYSSSSSDTSDEENEDPANELEMEDEENDEKLPELKEPAVVTKRDARAKLREHQKKRRSVRIVRKRAN